MNSKLSRWLPAVLWAAVIFWFSSQPSPPDLGPPFPFKRKVEHMVGYAILGSLVMRALRKAHALALPKAAALAIVIAAAYAASDEWHQSFVPGRHPLATDVLVDTAGASIAAASYWIYESRRSAKANRKTA
jgi:VanZ family protein